MTRQLAVEQWGDFAAGTVKPMVRLKGQWLADAGFAPGSRVLLVVVRPGLIELRSATAHDRNPDLEAERQQIMASIDAAMEKIA